MERYFEFKEGSSSKFWAVRCEGTSVFTRYGKIGAAGQTTVKDEGTEAKAQALMNKLVTEKTRKGYVEVESKGGTAPKEKAPTKPAPTKPAPDLDGARKALKADEPYLAWKRATGGDASTDGASLEQLELIVQALGSICSDLDEHGADNLDLYGGGKISVKKFFSLHDDAKAALRKLKNPGSGAPLAPLSAGPREVKLGAPSVLREGQNPVPLVTVNGFVSQDDQEKEHIVLRSTANGAVTVSLGIDGQRSVAVSPDGTRVAVGRWDTSVVVFDAKSGKQLFEAKEVGVDWVTGLAFSGDGKRLAVGSYGLAVLDATTGKQLALNTLGASSFDGHFIHGLAFSPDGTQLWAVHHEHLKVFDPATLSTPNESEYEGTDVLFALDARRAFAAPWGKVGIVDVENAELLASEKVKPYVSRGAVNATRTLGAAIVGDKKSTTLTVYGLNPFAVLATAKLPAPVDGTNSKGGVAFTDDAVLVATETKTFRVPMTTK